MTSPPGAAVTVPALLLVLAVVDGAFAGFRAGTGRNARIHKHDHDLRAAGRGVAVSMAGLTVTAVMLLPQAAQRYGDLIEAGTRMLMVLTPYALIVALSLVAYRLLPMRQSTLMILVGLGPLTLVRPAVVVTAAVAAGFGSSDRLVWLAAATAAAGVLIVEPWVHRRWYREPL
ncbi:oxidoreductase [Thermomonospora umbrina]|uniref:Uncharacterized protein n=1 Tax=Thermomonospora umbrina TaxID=111806 RepID=A0A3D9SZJ0_9ACTN|nr:oxidoreductase [Thermomonospora umbrina]REE97031.1 hypothetical protein DFJ69_2486 [Thermomonospora umbrina]